MPTKPRSSCPEHVQVEEYTLFESKSFEDQSTLIYTKNKSPGTLKWTLAEKRQVHL